MRSPGGLDSTARAYWLCVAVAAVSVVLAILISGVYTNATVWAGDAGSRADCGSVWEPNAGTSVCATALKERAWAAAALLGIALFGALGAVVVAGRSPRGFGPATHGVGGDRWGVCARRGTGLGRGDRPHRWRVAVDGNLLEGRA